MNPEHLGLLPIASIGQIAHVVAEDWGNNIYFGAKPYIDAMLTMEKITDQYYLDSGAEIVARFLANAQTWKGEVARTVKKELKDRLQKTYEK